MPRVLHFVTLPFSTVFIFVRGFGHKWYEYCKEIPEKKHLAPKMAIHTYVHIYINHTKLGDNVWQMWYLVSSSWGDQAAGLPLLSSPGGKKKRRVGSQATRMFNEWWIKLGNLAGLCWISRPTHDNLTPLFSRKKNISLNCHKILWVKDYQIPSFEALQHVTWRKTMD